MVGTRRSKRKAPSENLKEKKPKALADVSNHVPATISSPKKKRKISPEPRKPRKPSIKIEDVKEEFFDDDNVSLTESDSEEEEAENGMSALERRMRENAQDNANFFAKLEINTAKLDFEEVKDMIKKPKATSRGLKEKKVIEILPRRQSLRIQNKDPEGGDLPEREPTERFGNYIQSPYDVLRKSGQLSMVGVLRNDDEEGAHKKFLHSMNKLNCDVDPKLKLDPDLAKLMKSMDNMKINENQVAKVVPQRIFSVAIHPTVDKVLVAAGDKWGKVGFWDVDSKSNQDGVYCYEPHVRPVKHLVFPTFQSDRLYSCSYDGSLRCCHFEKETFDEIYATPEEEDVIVTGFDFVTPTNMVISQGYGGVVMLDTRCPKERIIHEVSQKTVRSVSIHPLQKDYIATGHADTTVSVWDVRKLDTKKPKSLYTLQHSRIVESAFFSPITGQYLLTTAMDDRLRLFDTSSVGKEANLVHSIRHNNHTGRWLSKFRAVWHPFRDDLFICGSMNRPRQIELFNTKGQMVKVFRDEDYLCSVCSLNAIHPTQNVIVGGNSSGRLHVFK